MLKEFCDHYGENLEMCLGLGPWAGQGLPRGLFFMLFIPSAGLHWNMLLKLLGYLLLKKINKTKMYYSQMTSSYHLRFPHFLPSADLKFSLAINDIGKKFEISHVFLLFNPQLQCKFVFVQCFMCFVNFSKHEPVSVSTHFHRLLFKTNSGACLPREPRHNRCLPLLF